MSRRLKGSCLSFGNMSACLCSADEHTQKGQGTDNLWRHRWKCSSTGGATLRPGGKIPVSFILSKVLHELVGGGWVCCADAALTQPHILCVCHAYTPLSAWQLAARVRPNFAKIHTCKPKCKHFKKVFFLWESNHTEKIFSSCGSLIVIKAFTFRV